MAVYSDWTHATEQRSWLAEKAALEQEGHRRQTDPAWPIEEARRWAALFAAMDHRRDLEYRAQRDELVGVIGAAITTGPLWVLPQAFKVLVPMAARYWRLRVRDAVRRPVGRWQRRIQLAAARRGWSWWRE